MRNFNETNICVQKAVNVSDMGLGMLKEQLNAINAESSYEIGKSKNGTNYKKGTGIGLLRCKSRATLTKGKLRQQN